MLTLQKVWALASSPKLFINPFFPLDSRVLSTLISFRFTTSPYRTLPELPVQAYLKETRLKDSCLIWIHFCYRYSVLKPISEAIFLLVVLRHLFSHIAVFTVFDIHKLHRVKRDSILERQRHPKAREWKRESTEALEGIISCSSGATHGGDAHSPLRW